MDAASDFVTHGWAVTDISHASDLLMSEQTKPGSYVQFSTQRCNPVLRSLAPCDTLGGTGTWLFCNCGSDGANAGDGRATDTTTMLSTGS